MSLKTDVQELMQELFDGDLNTSMAIRGDIQELMQEVFDGDLAVEQIAQTLTYHSAVAASGETYDPETGTYV